MPQRSITGSLRPQELEAIYAISKVVAEPISTESALVEIIKLARPVFIFDNVALYVLNKENQDLEPAFARAIGRGRSSAADLAWGEAAAHQAFETGKNYIREAEISPHTDRLDQRFYLGLPMIVGGKTLGALVFIRFGGPTYTEDQINLAEFIATHVSQLLAHQALVDRVANLEAERRLAKMQDDFIAAISHELNTPLGFIKGYTTTLLRQDTEWDEQTRRDFLTIIDDEADRLSELIENLLDSSRLQSGSMRMSFETLPVAELAKTLLERGRTRYESKDIRAKTELADVTVSVDTQRLAQVLDNLISNAAKYAPRSPVFMGIYATQKKFIIAVRDKGPGIPKEHLEHIFNRFYRVPQRSAGVRGSGLGLFICDQITKAHGGKIAAESTLGEGTTFQITLPVVEQQ
jgi:K+-sensing histidine kinase KdpD